VVVCSADILKRCPRCWCWLIDARTAAQGAEVVPVVSAADILKAKTLYIYKVINI
jgi:hypothetical protein